MTGRESNRVKDADKKKVLDDSARQRRARKALESLESDNFHEDPHADLVMSKKAPKFQDNLKNNKEKKGKRKGADYFRAKYRKNFQQLLEEAKLHHPNGPSYITAVAPEPKTPPRHFCGVCGDFSKYKCTVCGTRFCRVRCLRTHQETRCLKWII